VADRLYVDETKAKGYVLVAGIVLPADSTAIRKEMRKLVAPGQSRVHMKHEKVPRQHLIVAKLVALDLRVVIYEADRRVHGTDIACRKACLEQLVAEHATTCESVVFDSDPSQDGRDRQILVEQTRRHGCRDTMSYEHSKATVEPLLAIPDVVAWSWARDGDWRRRIRPIVERVVQV